MDMMSSVSETMFEPDATLQPLMDRGSVIGMRLWKIKNTFF